MAKSKKKKSVKKRITSKRGVRTKRIKTKRTILTGKKVFNSKNKKTKKGHHKKINPSSSEKIYKAETEKKEKAVMLHPEISTNQLLPSSTQQVPKPTNPKLLAKAKAALVAREKARVPALPFDKAAAEKQLKLPEPPNKLELEYIIHASPALLYEFISTPSGLSEWFADNVNIQESIYSFIWGGSEQKARLLSARENKSIRFQWLDRSPASYFELRIEKNELTDELSLFITDFADSPDEISSLERLWNEQVHRLMKVIGSKI